MIEIIKEGVGSYYFQLSSPEGNTLLRSIDFPSREAVNGIVEKLHSLTADHMVFERKTTHHGKFMFQLTDLNGKPLGTSQLYNSEAGMENGIKNLKNRIEHLQDRQNL